MQAAFCWIADQLTIHRNHFPVSFSIADTSCSRVAIRALWQAMKRHYTLSFPGCQTGWSFFMGAEAAVRETSELQVRCHATS